MNNKRYKLTCFQLLLAMTSMCVQRALPATLTCRGDGVTDVSSCVEMTFRRAQATGDRDIHVPKGRFLISRPIIIPDKTAIFGTGVGDGVTSGTAFIASDSFPLGANLFRFGDRNAYTSSPNYRVQIHNAMLDCNSRAGHALYNTDSEEQSYAHAVKLVNCTEGGMLVEGSGAQNSGPYRDIEVLVSSGTNSGTGDPRCIEVHNVVAFRGVDGLTCDGGTGAGPAIGIDIDGNGLYTRLKVQHFQTGLVLGRLYGADGMVVIGATFEGVQTGAWIYGNMPNQNIVLESFQCLGCNYILQNDLPGIRKQYSTTGFGFFRLGEGAGAGRLVWTSMR